MGSAGYRVDMVSALPMFVTKAVSVSAVVARDSALRSGVRCSRSDIEGILLFGVYIGPG